MYRQASHRQLKNRTLKRRVTSHHYSPKKSHLEGGEFATLRANQTALNKLTHRPELVVKVLKTLGTREKQSPDDPHLKVWRHLLNDLVDGKSSIEKISETVMGYDDKAKQLRQSALLECLLD